MEEKSNFSHAVVVVGTFMLNGRRFFLIKNSWSLPLSYLLWDEALMKEFAQDSIDDFEIDPGIHFGYTF